MKCPCCEGQGEIEVSVDKVREIMDNDPIYQIAAEAVEPLERIELGRTLNTSRGALYRAASDENARRDK